MQRNTPSIRLGLINELTTEADRRNVEFQLYDRMVPAYRENGIQRRFWITLFSTAHRIIRRMHCWQC